MTQEETLQCLLLASLLKENTIQQTSLGQYLEDMPETCKQNAPLLIHALIGTNGMVGGVLSV
jgi:hypothetical protein